MIRVSRSTAGRSGEAADPSESEFFEAVGPIAEGRGFSAGEDRQAVTAVAIGLLVVEGGRDGAPGNDTEAEMTLPRFRVALGASSRLSLLQVRRALYGVKR